jgi:hypothetical protein
MAHNRFITDCDLARNGKIGKKLSEGSDAISEDQFFYDRSIGRIVGCTSRASVVDIKIQVY